MTSFRASALLAAALLCAAPAMADDTAGAVDAAPLPDLMDAPTSTGPIAKPEKIAVSEINVVDGEPVGLIDEAAGGLGRDLWVDTPRDELEKLLSAIPITSNDPAVRSVARRLLLTQSESPTGSGGRPLIAIRIEKLLEAGLIDDASALAIKARLPGDTDFARVQANAILLAGDAANVCGDLTSERLSNGEAFWLELRAYCFATAGNSEQVDLLDQLLEAQGKTDDAYKMLRDDATRHLNYMPGLIAEPTPLHVFLLKAAGLSVPMELAVRFHLNAPQGAPVVDSGGYIVSPEQIEEALRAFATRRDNDQVRQRHSALVIGVADALGIPMVDSAQAVIVQIHAIQWTGARPSPVELQRIDEAAVQQGRRGEAMLRIIESLDSRDLGAMAPDAVAHLVRTLKLLGLEREARAIAARALREYRDVPPVETVAQ